MSTLLSGASAIDSMAYFKNMPAREPALRTTSKSQRTMRAIADAERIHIQTAREALGAL